jgi:hypothetical protein
MLTVCVAVTVTVRVRCLCLCPHWRHLGVAAEAE